jgi:hypothetical protein
MKRKCYILIYLILIVFSLPAQSSKRDSYGLKGNIKKVIQIGTTSIDSDTSFIKFNSYLTYLFDINGNILSVHDSIMNLISNNFYDSSGNLSQIDEYENGKFKNTTLIERKDSVLILYFKDEQGVIKRWGYYKLDFNDRIIEMGSYMDQNDTIKYIQTFKYDSNSFINEAKHIWGKHLMVNNFINSILKTDMHGNWILAESVSDFIMTKKSITKRIITYY